MGKIEYIKDIAKLDIFRHKRTGIPEFILSIGKSDEVISKLLLRMVENNGVACATKVNAERIEFIRKNIPKKFIFEYYQNARMIVLKKKNYKIKYLPVSIGILSAGSSDICIGEEARITVQLLGCQVFYDYDVGVAGMHRLIKPLKRMVKERVKCIIVVAGMDGILPTLVKSLVDLPVIGVPTSIGYGYGSKGESSLMTMLNSCSPGLVVVNIDNGFGAGCAAYLIAKQSVK
ncbi:MAG: nickel pincer cofactor biosynthesis protein LarB [Candidatus Omnitrophica bacterium]|nr:nickel pincer cofactor biosynthesis protein LarB [Candidatus Omnitrophota bacterium]